MQYLNKSFSVYANYAVKPHCEICGQESNVYWQTVDGRLCNNCHDVNKRKKNLEKLSKND